MSDGNVLFNYEHQQPQIHLIEIHREYIDI